jgi:hypothetical protein
MGLTAMTMHFVFVRENQRSWDTAVGTATGYGLDDQMIGVRVPVR